MKFSIHQMDDKPENPPQAPMVYVFEDKQWQYKQVKYDSPPNEDKLNKLGKEGWELVSLIQHEGEIHAYFKRQLS